MDPGETEWRSAVLIRPMLLALLGDYGLLLAGLRARMSQPLSAGTSQLDLFVSLVLVGAVQFAVFSVIARKRLRSNAGEPAARARLYFLLRAVASEAIGLCGMLIGLHGGPVFQPIVLFALALAAILVCAPTREAWQNALRLAESQNP